MLRYAKWIIDGIKIGVGSLIFSGETENVWILVENFFQLKKYQFFQ